MTRLTLPHGAVSFLAQGAIIQELVVDGHNLVLSFETPGPYLTAPFFSETIGRVANRINNGRIDNLNGRSYQLAVNDKNHNALHGGTVGWGKKRFQGPEHVTRHGHDALQYVYVSPDGEEGFPGTVELRVWYVAREVVEHAVSKLVLEIEYEVEFTGRECEETCVNITNHSYFNLGVGATIESTQVSLATANHLPVDAYSIPTGEIVPYPGIHANEMFTLGATEPAIDHCFIMEQDVSKIALDTRQGPLHQMVRAYHPLTRVHLDVLSTEPAFQFYTGDGTNVPASEHGPERGARSGFCVEPSRYVNAVNVPNWRPQVVLPRGQIYGSKIVYSLWKS